MSIKNRFMAIAAVGLQIGLAAPAAAVPGLHTEISDFVPLNSSDFKSAFAECPPGERVIGGGGVILTQNADPNKLVLTGLRPVSGNLGGIPDRYVVEAAEIAGGVTGDWLLRAEALCAPPPPGWQIVSKKTDSSSNPVQATFAKCPSHQRVIGTGARVSSNGGEVYLQVARASGLGDIARAQGHEDANGFSGNWSVTAYAVCVDTPPGYEVVFDRSDEQASETRKTASAACPTGTQVHGGGAAVTNVAPGNIALQKISPLLIPGTGTLRDLVTATAGEATPTSANWDFIVAAAICAF